MNSNQQILFSHIIISPQAEAAGKEALSPLGKKIHQTSYREVIFWPMGQYFLLALCNV